MTGNLTITNALVFDGTSPDLVEGTIEVRDGSIATIGGASSGERVVDAGGRVVMPGLIDAHFHAYGITLNGFFNDHAPLSYVALVGATRVRAALRRGFTTVRDVAGGDKGFAMALDKQVIEGPRYLYTGPALSQTGGHGDPRSDEMELDFCGGHSNQIVDGVADLRRVVRDRFRTGAHAIKIMASGGVISPVDPLEIPQYSADEIQAVADEAARRGSYVAAHAYSAEAVQHAVANGVRSIEHGNLMDADAARAMAATGSTLVPTLIAYDAMRRRGAELGLPETAQHKNKEVFASGQRAIELARDAGVRIAYGSDLLGGLEEEQLNGLRLQAEILGNLETLKSATSVGAGLIGRSDLGGVSENAVADLLILDGNPLDDIDVLVDADRPRTVVQAGHVVFDSLELEGTE
ncbi:metal-dependent hydrolase family protein [Paramicrobacterium agarici]|uniref:metal-dependent hydrolase family protein n=1 Tax=Paramicrobacterium agarici TaxID=630514 RepID=UPI00114F4DAD|nr:amidohydrolase family protein [Microbacterium agarici]TQO22944.1 imidazolonepropionase-like amidohydrolase [Microbacterium agarici]